MKKNGFHKMQKVGLCRNWAELTNFVRHWAQLRQYNSCDNVAAFTMILHQNKGGIQTSELEIFSTTLD